MSASLKTERRWPGLLGWSMYDFANSAFTTIIITFVFSVYFSTTLVCSAEWAGCLTDAEEAKLSLEQRLNGTAGQAAWGYAMAFAGLLVGLIAPVFGAIADRSGRRKPWILIFSLISIGCTAALSWMVPEAQYILPAILLVAIANLCFELGITFNSAMLPNLASEKSIGRWSGFAWGLGYFGGLVSLVMCLVLILGAETGEARLEATLLSPMIVAVWFFIFMIPMFLLTPDAPKGEPLGMAVKNGLGQIVSTLKSLAGQGNMVRFLLSRLLYIDGTNTLFAMGATYAALRYGMEIDDIIVFGILLNVTSGLGAMAFGFLDDRVGPKFVIMASLVGLIALGLPGIFIEAIIGPEQAATGFIVIGSLLGIFVGPVQAASRSAMARMAPKDQMTEYFGIMAFTGRITAFLGPLLVALVSSATGNLDYGMLPIMAFWFLGLLGMLTVTIKPMRLA